MEGLDVEGRDAFRNPTRRSPVGLLGLVALSALLAAPVMAPANAVRGLDEIHPPVPVASLPIYREPEAAEPDVAAAPPAIPAIPDDALVPEPMNGYGPARLTLVTRGELAAGDTLGRSLRAQGIAATHIHRIDRGMRGVFDFRRSQPGHRYRLTQAPDGTLLEFRYTVGAMQRYRLWLDGEDYRAERETVELEPRVARIAGTVTSTLYGTIRSLGEDPQLASAFADVFAWDIDFSRSVQPGDDFRILYERLFTTDDEGQDVYVRPGRILAARYRGAAGDHAAVFFEDAGHGGYFRPDGSSVEREFLASPVRYGRISSRYTKARRHPILKITRPHFGIDYAAPHGTPVWAVADGTVIYRGWGGSFGNLVKIRHANGYVSYYSHLSGFADDIAVGATVAQKGVIGYVGDSGLATGPHVCFRVSKNGRYVNPLALRSPVGAPVAEAQAPLFAEQRDSLLAALDHGPTLAMDEAL